MVKTGLATDELCFWHDPGNCALMLKPEGFVEPYRTRRERVDLVA